MYLYRFIRFMAVCFSLSCFTAYAASNEVVETTSINPAVIPLAPGYGKLPFKLPPVGSYHLPVLAKAANGKVLDETGTEQSLHDLYAGKYNLLSFIYSNCSDVNGCPLSSYVFYKLKKAMNQDPELAKKLQLLSLSFDPERDTPEVMRLYGANFSYAGNQGSWRFLTTTSLAELTPILKNYNQDLQREKSVNGDQSEDISHILRVFLIDPQMNIRNIYSVGFLHADTIINDVKTLFLEDARQPLARVKPPKMSASLSVAGDMKEGYEKSSYTTRSKALTERKGKQTDLLAIANNPPTGLPRVPVPADNPLTREKISLGRKLFFDRRLSLNNTISCAMCHVPEQGFTSNELSMAVGMEGRSVRRNSPTIYNVAYATKLFHDGREQRLEEQVWGPLLAHREMANPSIGYVLNKIRQFADYEGLFETAFHGKGVTIQTVGEALASYERTLISADSMFDRWFYANKTDALTPQAKHGYQLFTGKARCSSCHLINQDYALFTDNQLHNTGIGYQESMGIKPAKERIVLAPGVFVEVDSALVDAVGEQAPADLGLYEITQNPQDRWKYKTPSLRNIDLTAPYMHNGSLSTLIEVVNFYNRGGIQNKLLDPVIQPLHLSDVEKQDLVAFLESLTGSNVDTLVADAFAAPIGDLTQNDPNWAHQEKQGND